ncbi:MAG: dihydroorotase, partial [Methylophaga sp.]|nr:dihydroorotase [Methylophaga sp.]
DINHCRATLEIMQKLGLPLLIHGEVTDHDIDIFDREKRFIADKLMPLIKDFPDLKVVFEHITTSDATQFVEAAGPNMAATITPHHLLFNRNDLLVGGIRPHYFCLPVLKRNSHQQALLQAATSGNPKFFLGTDSAPHPRPSKENSCGCAGIYSAHAAIELYAEVFEAMDALDKLEAFASFYGADFYGLPRNKSQITLHKQSWQVPETLAFADSELVPLRAGESVHWQIV